ncbi:GOLPH3/VPS74 family protein [Streptomyces tendae]
MTTARDLALIALNLPPGRAGEQGDLSLALAGAEVVDLLAAGALRLDGDRLVPGDRKASGDRLLDQALDAVVSREPLETLPDWIWRRGDGLAAAYAEELSKAGPGEHPRRHGLRRASARTAAVTSSEHTRARERLESGDPVLTALTGFLTDGVLPPDTGDTPSDADSTPSLTGDDTDGDDAVTAVLAAVGDAVTELEAVRLRRSIEADAFDNIWRA